MQGMLNHTTHPLGCCFLSYSLLRRILSDADLSAGRVQHHLMEHAIMHTLGQGVCGCESAIQASQASRNERSSRILSKSCYTSCSRMIFELHLADTHAFLLSWPCACSQANTASTRPDMSCCLMHTNELPDPDGSRFKHDGGVHLRMHRHVRAIYCPPLCLSHPW